MLPAVETEAHMTSPNWASHIESLKKKKDLLRKAELSLRRKRARCTEEETLLKTACHAAIEKALAQYNQSIKSGYHITVGQLDPLRFYDDYHAFSISVRLRTATGFEPDEEFHLDEEEGYATKLRPYIEKEFAEAQLPLTFSGISVPINYYMK
jgi:hypothetical protein